MRDVERMLAKLPFAPIVGALFALVAVVLVIATPQWLFERWVSVSGIASIISAATPPLGEKARILAAVVAGIGVGGMLWSALTLGERLLRRSAVGHEPDEVAASPAIDMRRRPLSADNELGAPLMSDEAMAQAREELVLDMPLADDLDDKPPVIEAEPEMVEADGWAAPPVEVLDARPELAKVSKPARLEQVVDQSIPALLSRLESAISRKPTGYRPGRGDISKLRRVLGR